MLNALNMPLSFNLFFPNPSPIHTWPYIARRPYPPAPSPSRPFLPCLARSVSRVRLALRSRSGLSCGLQASQVVVETGESFWWRAPTRASFAEPHLLPSDRRTNQPTNQPTAQSPRFGHALVRTIGGRAVSHVAVGVVVVVVVEVVHTRIQKIYDNKLSDVCCVSERPEPVNIIFISRSCVAVHGVVVHIYEPLCQLP